jgi:transcriptional regulator with PAS, ATPase and Fis domain
MKRIMALARHVAQSDMTVLLTGETGTGKDLLARYIHFHSGRKGRFITVNAAAIPNAMIESELFGYARGAFTGADKDKPGLVEMADGGTFYLNELSDATPEFQAKLLEVLETHTIRRLGENKERHVAFRLIAATNDDLRERIRKDKFRLDLYHRLNEIPIHLPPLRQRQSDIPALVKYFLQEHGCNINNNGNCCDMSRLCAAFANRVWAGNVRQLKAEIAHLWLVSRGNLSTMAALAKENAARCEQEQLWELLKAHNWNQREVARHLGLSEGTIRYRIKKYGLARPAEV